MKLFGGEVGSQALARFKNVFVVPASEPELVRWMGARPLVVLEAGARGGPNPRWTAFGDAVHVVGVEADAAECARLNRELAGATRRFVCAALGRERGTATLHVTSQPGCSSLYPPNAELVAEFATEFREMMREVGTREVELETLDALAAEHAVVPDVLCLDVQGAELDVLQGGPRSVEHAMLVEAEVELAPEYRGQPLFADVDSFMRARGFALRGFRRTFWRRRSARGVRRGVAGGQLVHADALYVNERRLASGEGTTPDLVRWLVALAAYRQDDLIAQLLERHPSSAGLDPELRGRLERVVLPPQRTSFRLARRVLALIHEPHHLTLRHWVTGLRNPPALDWHDPDFF